MRTIRSNMKNIKRIWVLGALAVGMMQTLAACGDTAATDQPAVTTTDTPADTPAIIVPSTDTPATAMSSDPATPAQPDMQSDMTPTPAVATDGNQSGGSGTAVQATLKEWAITLSQSEVPAGKVTFTVTNEGMMAHNFTVVDSSGNIVNGTPNFAGPQGPQTLSVDLQAGNYTVLCTLPGHAARGQKAELVVK